MAIEALIIWVHPFNDGNGRTSRFLGKFIEDGAVDVEDLIVSTVDRLHRMREYGDFLRVDTANIYRWLGDWVVDRPSDDELQRTEMSSTEGIVRSLDRLLRDKTWRERVYANTELRKARHAEFLARQAARNLHG